MRRLSLIVPHFRTWRWTSICIHAFKKYGMLVDSEIIVCDNSPGHHSIKCLTETPLGDGVKIVSGEPDFTSHGRGYEKAYEIAAGDWIFTSETDSFPTRHGWFNEYIKASADCDMVGPEVPQSSGRYIHPAGCAVRRTVLDAAIAWQATHKDWLFVPGMAVALGTSNRPYHVVCSKVWLNSFAHELPAYDSIMQAVELWARCGPWQEMRSFDEDTFEDYGKRVGIKNFEPIHGKAFYNKIGYEAGQWLHYFAEKHGFRCVKAPSHIEWMIGREGGQAAYSNVFDGFRHIWAGSVVQVSPKDMDPAVVAYKNGVMNQMFNALPDSIRQPIEELERTYGP